MIVGNNNRNNSNNRRSIYQSRLVENNPIVVQLIEFGYSKIYSRRVFYYFHPEDLEEALNYMSVDNGIIQHRFIQDRRNNSNKMCYICGEEEDKHLIELNVNNINSNIIEEDKKDENDNINNNGNKIILKDNIIHSRNFSIKEDNNKNEINNNFLASERNELKLKKENINLNNIDQKIIYNNIEVSNDYPIETQKSNDSKLSQKMECPICNDDFIETEKNKVEKCGHSFCDSCWYDFLSVNIKENKLPSIKCLEHDCGEKLTDEFIINLLNSDTTLIKKYKRYKLELEIMKDPNKKLCPYPDCDSYLELKEIREKDVKCLNNHKYCFVCLKKPHGTLPCEAKMDSSLINYAKNHFVKKCPKCGIITEKNNGCNHITCSNCGHQWCWLCNETYIAGHFNDGKCKGFQFFQPKNDYEIKLVMEGKIKRDELPRSQIQFINDDDVVNIDILAHNDINVGINHNPMEQEINIEQGYNLLTTPKKIIIFILYILFGHFLYTIEALADFLRDRELFFYLIIVFANSIAFWIQFIYINIILLIPILFIYGIKELLYNFPSCPGNYGKKLILLIMNLITSKYISTFLRSWKKIIEDSILSTLPDIQSKFQKIVFISGALMHIVILFPQRLIFNGIYIILTFFCNNVNDCFRALDEDLKTTFDFSLLDR